MILPFASPYFEGMVLVTLDDVLPGLKRPMWTTSFGTFILGAACDSQMISTISSFGYLSIFGAHRFRYFGARSVAVVVQLLYPQLLLPIARQHIGVDLIHWHA